MNTRNAVQAGMEIARDKQSQTEQFEALCKWIDAHIDEPIGWQTLIEQSGLDYQALQSMFFKFESTTAMTWIRRRRSSVLVSDKTVQPLMLVALGRDR